MKFKAGDRVNVYIPGEETPHKGTVCFTKAPDFVAVDLDCGALTDWFRNDQCKKLKKKEVDYAKGYY